MTALLRWLWPPRPDPRDRCVRCRAVHPIRDMREHGDNDWVCRWCR